MTSRTTPISFSRLNKTVHWSKLHSEVCSCHLCDLGVILQLLQLALIVRDEVFEHGVVAVHAVLSLGQLHASVQLLNIQQDILQRHYEHEQQCDRHVQTPTLSGKKSNKNAANIWSVRLTCCSFLHVVQLVVEERNLCIFLLYHIGDVV